MKAGPGHGRAWADIGFAASGPLNLKTDLRDFDLAWLQPLGALFVAALFLAVAASGARGHHRARWSGRHYGAVDGDGDGGGAHA